MIMDPHRLDDLRAALDWQIEMGADEAIGDVFIDRTSVPLPSAQNAEKRPASSPQPASKNADASALAAACEDLSALKNALAAFSHPLRESAKNCVFADGNPAARIMIIGEAPGRDEDLQGLPFVGRSGQLLDKMLACIGLDRNTEDIAKAVYIANIIPWRPVGNRTPSTDEAATFLPFIDRHISLIDPAVLITMGNVSTKTLLATKTGIMRLRGTWTEAIIGGKNRTILPMLHPAYLLRQPVDKGRAWQDLLSLQTHLEDQS